MTTCESLVRALLLADANVSAAVGGVRIYPLIRPQGTPLPALTYQRVSVVRLDPLPTTAVLASARLQLDCWAATYGAVKDLAIYVRRVLNGYVQTGAGPLPRLAAARLMANDRDEYEEEPPVYRVSTDYSVWWEED